MKFFTRKGVIQKILIAIVIVILFNCVVPMYSYAGIFTALGSSLLKELVQLLAQLGDVIMGLLNNVMLGAEGISGMDSAMLNEGNINLTDPSSWIYWDKNDGQKADVTIENGYLDSQGLFGSKLDYPNMLYSPENIFMNRIGALDVNFINPNTYTSVITGEQVKYDDQENLLEQDKQVSYANIVSPIISEWYKAFRNIAIVGLLSVLVYLGIRILISSSAPDKAKYKENMKDWFVALCLVFTIHIIMSGVLMLTNQCTQLFSQSIGDGIKVEVEGQETAFKTNLIGLVRFKAQAKAWQDATAYSLIYVALVIYTLIFTVQYFKRFLYMAFFTMIAPLVALTYPIDRAGDGRSQAFNLWFKEYTMNAIIQPVHLILYVTLVGTATDLVTKNPLYALVAIAFMFPAEKFIKKLFGINAETTSGAGFAGGALAMAGLQKMASLGKDKDSSKKNGSGNSIESGDGKIKFADTGNKNLGAFQGNSQNDDQAGGQNDNDDRPRLAQQEGDNDDEELNAQGDAMLNWEENNGGTQLNEGNDNYGELDSQHDANDNRISVGEDDGPENPQLDQHNEGNNRINPPVAERPGWRSRVALKGAKKIGKKVFRGAVRATGVGLGAGIGLAAGLTTGDPSKVFTYGAAGAVAGNVIGKNTANIATGMPNTIRDMTSRARQWNENRQFDVDKERYGLEYATQQRNMAINTRARRELVGNKTEREKWERYAGEFGYNGNTDTLMNAVADIKEAGFDDDDTIKNVLKAEHKTFGIGSNDSKHRKMIDAAKFSKGFDKEYVLDKKKREVLKSKIAAKVSNADAQREVMQMIADINGEGDTNRLLERQERQTRQTRQPRQPGNNGH